MRLLIITILFMMVSVAGAQDKDIGYDDHGKRDPLWKLVSPSGAILSYDADLQREDMVLEGIIADSSGSNVAIINGVIVKPNDKIGLYVVSGITADTVTLTKGQESFVLRLKREE